jgi:hypothetical protein
MTSKANARSLKELRSSQWRRTDAMPNRFKGVGVGAWGSYVVWENQGFHEGRASEVAALQLTVSHASCSSTTKTGGAQPSRALGSFTLPVRVDSGTRVQ